MATCVREEEKEEYGVFFFCRVPLRVAPLKCLCNDARTLFRSPPGVCLAGEVYLYFSSLFYVHFLLFLRFFQSEKKM